MGDMEQPTRRTFVKSAAWSVPVIAAAVAMPLAAASQVPVPRIPTSCTLLNGKGKPVYRVTYSVGPDADLSRNEVVIDPKLKAMCPVPANGNEG